MLAHLTELEMKVLHLAYELDYVGSLELWDELGIPEQEAFTILFDLQYESLLVWRDSVQAWVLSVEGQAALEEEM